MSHQLIYWITRLDSIRALSKAFLVISLFAFLVCVIIYFATLGDKKPFPIQYAMKIASIFLLISALMLVFVPSSKEAAAIYLLPKVVNNEEVQKIPNNAVKLLNAKMEEWMDDKLGTEDKEKKE